MIATGRLCAMREDMKDDNGNHHMHAAILMMYTHTRSLSVVHRVEEVNSILRGQHKKPSYIHASIDKCS